jgi:hypothetical protein
MRIGVRGGVVTDKGSGRTVKRRGLLSCAGSPSNRICNIAAHQEFIRSGASSRDDIETNIVEALAAAKASASKELR